MEIKATLNKPYTDKERMDFIVQYNHNLGYEIRETETALEAWGDTQEELLEQAKQAKYKEANAKANEFLQSGEALYEFEEGKHIEATDGNIAKMTAYALAYVTGQLQPEDTVIWNTKEDETVNLNQQQIVQILQGLGQVQAIVWSEKYPAYIKAIDEAQTLEEVEAIEIDYTLNLSINSEPYESEVLLDNTISTEEN